MRRYEEVLLNDYTGNRNKDADHVNATAEKLSSLSYEDRYEIDRVELYEVIDAYDMAEVVRRFPELDSLLDDVFQAGILVGKERYKEEQLQQLQSK